MAERNSAIESRPPFNLAYVMTHYPRVALTFIAGEIDELERHGARISPIVMNEPGPADLTTPEARARQHSSLYLKASAGRIAGATISAFASHPLKMCRLAISALRSARSDVGLMTRRLVHLGYAALAAKYCRERDIGHLHAQFGLAPATIAWFACEILNFRPAAACTWSFTIHGFQDFIDEANARLDLKAASASFVICVSDFTKSQLCRVSDPRLWDRFRVVRCGINIAAFPMRAHRPLRDIPRIVVVGRLSPEKGHSILLEAIRKLADEDIPVEAEIIGDGPFAGTIRERAADLGIEQQIVFAGELLPAEVAQRVADADIFCMASFSEGLPISIMEAMAVGTPVVTTWISGIPELAIDKVTAMTIPPADSDALAAAIKQLRGDPALCTRMVKGGRAAVERMHSRDINGAELAEMFGALLDAKVSA